MADRTTEIAPVMRDVTKVSAQALQSMCVSVQVEVVFVSIDTVPWRSLARGLSRANLADGPTIDARFRILQQSLTVSTFESFSAMIEHDRARNRVRTVQFSDD